MKLHTFFSLTCWAMFSVGLQAQGWERSYTVMDNPPPTMIGSEARYAMPTPDGGYITGGSYNTYISGSPTFDYQSAYMRKYNAFGEEQWTHTYNYAQFEDYIHMVCPIGTLGYMALMVLDGSMTRIMRTDAWGDTLWTRTLPGISEMAQFAETGDGNWLFAAKVSGSTDRCLLTKINLNGDTLWTREVRTAFQTYVPRSLRPHSDGGFVMAGHVQSVGVSPRLHLCRTNANGDTLWTRHYELPGSSFNYGYDAVPLADGGFVVAGQSILSAGNQYIWWLLRTDAGGDTLWTRTYAGAIPLYQSGAYSVDVANDGNWVVSGMMDAATHVKKLSQTDGSVLWERSFDPAYSQFNSIRSLSDGGYILSGKNNFTQALLCKLDGLGNTYTNFVRGKVFSDTDNDCGFSSGETPLSGWTVTVQNAQHTYTASTNAAGEYFVPVDTGNYTVSISPVNAYWQANCVNNVPLACFGSYDTTTVDFPMEALVSCSLLEVDISTPILRRCFNNYYYVQYCNQGTITEQGGLLFVELDSFMSFVSSVPMPLSVVGNQLTYNLPPIAPNQCGSVQITVNLSCSAQLGQTHCVRANTYPNFGCGAAQWQGALIEAQAQCLGDSVLFTLHNAGADMGQALNYLIYEDNVMVRPGTFQLDAGESALLYVQANGATYRIEAQQALGIPSFVSDSLVAAFVEGCNGQGGVFSMGFINQFAPYNGSPFEDIDCRPNVGSYDPNDKQAVPEGYGAEHYIYAHTDLDYRIRFQNTGTDTAFNVYILDTLSAHLDPASIVAGASSHAYVMDLVSERILRFKFDNIMLPDSHVNEPASQGFVCFRIKQRPGNAVGTLIENSAAIYFDFNEPVITNTTFHEIGDHFVLIASVDEPSLSGGAAAAVRVYPNPFEQSATWQTEDGRLYESLRLTVFDAQGREVGQWQAAQSDRLVLERPTHWLPGLYFYRMEGDGSLLGTGKLRLSN